MNGMGCGSESASKFDAGMLAFDSSAGQACLDALAAADCTAAGFNQINLACFAANYLSGTTPVGDPCDESADCRVQDAGPLSTGESAPGCSFDEQLACAGVCSVGLSLGDSCAGSGLVVGCGSGQGRCTYVATTPDGGSGDYCAAFVADGGACTDTAAAYDCDSSFEYCADAGLSTLICQPQATPGAACDPVVCQYPAQCPCPASEVCAPPSDGGPGSYCGGIIVHTPCSLTLAYPCGPYGSCTAVSWADGGDESFCSATATAVGDPCDFATTCADTLACSGFVSGVCVLPGGLGAKCSTAISFSCAQPLLCVTSDGGTQGSCQAFASAIGSSCTETEACATLLYCLQLEDGGSVCLPQLNLGDPCNSLGYGQCASGFCAPPADGGSTGACTPQLGFGQPCSPLAGDACADGNICYSLPADGGGICGSVICAD